MNFAVIARRLAPKQSNAGRCGFWIAPAFAQSRFGGLSPDPP